MSKIRAALVLVLALVAMHCDGTLMGIGRVPRPPETSLPPAPVETVTSNEGPEGPRPPPADQPQMISAQHLLVMFAGSKAAPSNIKRSRDEARTRAAEALQRIKQGQDFDKVVAAYTDEPGGAARHGDLGRFSRDTMVKAFSDAAFALAPGQVSAVIESPFGFHVIRRNE